MKNSGGSQLRWPLIGIVIGIVFLSIAMAKVDFRSIGRVLSHANPIWVTIVLAGTLVFMALKTLRWQSILVPIMQVRFGVLHSAVYVGTASNLVVPHSGELLRAAVLARREGASSSAVLATIAIERLLDFVVLLAFASAALVIDSLTTPLLWLAGQVTAAILVVALILLLAVLKPTPALTRLFHASIGWLPQAYRTWLTVQITSGKTGLAVLRSPVTVVRLLLLSFLQWTAIVAAIWSSANAVGIDVSISAAIAVFVLTVIGLTLPSAPAQLGTLQLAFVVGLALAEADATTAVAASLVYTCFANVAMMLIGAACLSRSGALKTWSVQPRSQPTRTT